MRMKNRMGVFITLAGSAWLALRAEATFLQPDLRQVPTERLLTNLEAKAKENPKPVELIYAAARVHAIAYARNQAQFQVQPKDEMPFFGFTDHGFLPEPSPAGAGGQLITWRRSSSGMARR